MGSPVRPLMIFNTASVAQLIPVDFMPLVGKMPPIKLHPKFGVYVFDIPDSLIAWFTKGETTLKITNSTQVEYCEELDDPVSETPDPNAMLAVSCNVFTPMLPGTGSLKAGFRQTQASPVASSAAQVSTIAVADNNALLGKFLRVGYVKWTFSASAGSGLIQVGAAAGDTETNIGAAINAAAAAYRLCNAVVATDVTLTAITAGVGFDLVSDAGGALTLATGTPNATANTNYTLTSEWDDQAAQTDYGLSLLGRRLNSNQYGASFCPRVFLKEADEWKLMKRKNVERNLNLEGPLSAVRSDGQVAKFWKREDFTINPTTQIAV